MRSTSYHSLSISKLAFLVVVGVAGYARNRYLQRGVVSTKLAIYSKPTRGIDDSESTRLKQTNHSDFKVQSTKSLVESTMKCGRRGGRRGGENMWRSNLGSFHLISEFTASSQTSIFK